MPSPKMFELKEGFEARQAVIISRKTTAQTSNIDDSDYKNCRIHIVGNSGLIECRTDEKYYCKWEAYFGTTRFCMHPLAKQFTSQNNAN